MDNRERITALAQTAQQGSQDAFNELYRLTRDRAYFVAFTITRNEQDALDIVQDSYLKAWQALGGLRNPGQFTAWLQQITGNTAKDYIKHHQPLLFLGGDDATDDLIDLQAEKDSDYIPDSSMDTEETKRLIMEIVDDLPEDQRLCTLMYYYDDIPVADIAAALGLAQNTVKTRLRLARGKIGREVESLEKKQGIKLYSAAPFLLFLWLLRHLAAENSSKLPPVVLSSPTAGTMGAGTAMSAALTSKIIAGIVATVVIAVGAVTGITIARRDQTQLVAARRTVLAHEGTMAMDSFTLPILPVLPTQASEIGTHANIGLGSSKQILPTTGYTTATSTRTDAAQATAATKSTTTARSVYAPPSTTATMSTTTATRVTMTTTTTTTTITTTTTTTTTAPPGPVKITRSSNGVIFEYMSDVLPADAQFTAAVGGGSFTTLIVDPVADVIVETFRLTCSLNGTPVHNISGLTIRLPVPAAALPDIALLEVQHCMSPMNPVTVTATIDNSYLVFTTNYV